MDIGPQTASSYQRAIRAAKTVFVNGPMGVFEKPETENGTRMVWDAPGRYPGLHRSGGAATA